ncbi:hypothetical protein EC991_007080 [Linnemannia zychae]|nr:hypothetical protein EC991_007080 [Linnemannia zychae]
MDDILVFARTVQDCRTKYLDDIAEEDFPALKRVTERCNGYDPMVFHELISSTSSPRAKAYRFDVVYSMLASISVPTYHPGPNSNGVRETNGMILSLLDPSREQRQDVIAHLRKIGFFNKEIVRKIIEFSKK